MKKFAVELAGASLGAYAGTYLSGWVLKLTGMEAKEGFGIDDVIIGLSIGLGAYAGLKAAGKIVGD